MVTPPEFPLIAVVGPTAVGKTSLSLELAEAITGEIISADSRLFYREMDIGTAKPSPAEQARCPHHLIDIVNPDQTLNLAAYQRLAYAIIDDIHRRHRVPLLVGGSGQYVNAILEGWRIPEIPPDPSLRKELETLAQIEGAAALHARLAQEDPVAATRIDYRNTRRVVRALEVTLLAGRPISEIQSKSNPPYQIARIGLIRPRSVLFTRIDARIEQMLARGLLQEVQTLIEAGYEWSLPSMSGLGYRQIGLHLQGLKSLEEAVKLIARETRRLVRQQATWFRLDDPRIRWFDLEQHGSDSVINYARSWLKSSP